MKQELGILVAKIKWGVSSAPLWSCHRLFLCYFRSCIGSSHGGTVSEVPRILACGSEEWSTCCLFTLLSLSPNGGAPAKQESEAQSLLSSSPVVNPQHDDSWVRETLSPTPPHALCMELHCACAGRKTASAVGLPLHSV